MIYATTVFALLASVAYGKLYTESHGALKYMFEQYKQEYGKTYSTMEEENTRYTNFVNNLKSADERNLLEKQAGGSAVHGITKFSDLSQDEFAKRFLTSKPSMKSNNTPVMDNVPVPVGVGSTQDWSGRLTTPVKNQGYCGSCWAFSATEQIESDSMRVGKGSYVLSPEQITQCDTTSYGCDGGWTEHAFDYVKRAGGIETENDYPYTSYYGTTGQCHSTASKYVVGVSSYTKVSGETNMANYVLGTGPLSVCVDASSWNSYNGGIMSSCGNRVDHCVQAVGVNTGSGGYWKVRNSWGTSWGEAGYIRLSYGSNTCDITNDPTWVSVK